MFKAIKDNKILAINDSEIKGGLVFDEIVEDTEHSVSDYEQYHGEFLLKSDIPAPTLEEQKEKRAKAYLIEVDPITTRIYRLRDEAEPDEEKITKLIAERNAKVAEVKERFPYPESEAEDG